MIEAITAGLEDIGWVVVRDIHSTNEFVQLSKSLGRIVIPPKRQAVQQLIARNFTGALANTYTAYYGLGGFPFHTDMANWTIPPRYVLLRHCRGSLSTPTLLLDSRFLLRDFERESLSRGVWIARAAKRSFVVNVLSKSGDEVLFRWDSMFLKPQSNLAKKAHKELIEQIALEEQERSVPIYYEPSNALIIDNWRILHARPVLSYDGEERVLERTLVM